MMDIDKLTESSIVDEADRCLSNALDVVEKHGVCYLRFTRDDGIQVIDPRYYKKFNGIISDA